MASVKVSPRAKESQTQQPTGIPYSYQVRSENTSKADVLGLRHEFILKCPRKALETHLKANSAFGMCAQYSRLTIQPITLT